MVNPPVTHGSAFHITCLLWGESIDHQWNRTTMGRWNGALKISLALAWGNFRSIFYIVIQIRYKIGISVTPLQVMATLRNFAHAIIAQLSCHVENIIAIASLWLERQQNYISVEFKLRLKDRSWTSSCHQWDGLVFAWCHIDAIYFTFFPELNTRS